MDAETIKWADRQLRRVKVNADPMLVAHGFAPAWHNAGLLAFTTCTTCGAALCISTRPGEDSATITDRLQRHWRRHHPLEAVRAHLTARVQAYLAWRDANRLG